MSQYYLHTIIRQQQEQLVAMQVQIQTLIAEGASVEAGGAIERSNTGSNIEVAKLPVFNGEVGRVGGFIIVCRLYLRMWIRGEIAEEQIQWVLSYMQEGSADVWKENLLENLETGEVEFRSAGKFLLELKKEFGGRNKELVKIVELRRIE